MASAAAARGRPRSQKPLGASPPPGTTTNKTKALGDPQTQPRKKNARAISGPKKASHPLSTQKAISLPPLSSSPLLPLPPIPPSQMRAGPPVAKDANCCLGGVSAPPVLCAADIHTGRLALCHLPRGLSPFLLKPPCTVAHVSKQHFFYTAFKREKCTLAEEARLGCRETGRQRRRLRPLEWTAQEEGGRILTTSASPLALLRVAAFGRRVPLLAKAAHHALLRLLLLDQLLRLLSVCWWCVCCVCGVSASCVGSREGAGRAQAQRQRAARAAGTQQQVGEQQAAHDKRSRRGGGAPPASSCC